jgi:hypothetical protein
MGPVPHYQQFCPPCLIDPPGAPGGSPPGPHQVVGFSGDRLSIQPPRSTGGLGARRFGAGAAAAAVSPLPPWRAPSQKKAGWSNRLRIYRYLDLTLKI